MTRAKVIFGKIGEDLACRELEARGYEIIARRLRVRGGELDIIARDGETTVFVEVKAREGHDYGDAAGAVTPVKRGRLMQLAVAYAAQHALTDRPCRFDVVTIHLDAGNPAVEIFQNAFDLA